MPGLKVPQEFWSSYIVEKLFKSNPHLMLAFNESKFVKGGAVVYIPQAGARPTVVKNRATFPAVAVERGDTSVVYTLDTWSTSPTVITWDDAQQISYAKTDSVMGDHTGTLAEVVGDEMLYNWVRGFVPAVGGGTTVSLLPVSRIIPTSGAATAVNSIDGQTGTRKAFTFKEIANLQGMFNKDNVLKTDRYGVVESYMLTQLLDSLTANQMHAFEQTADLKNGIIGKLYGFTLLDRSSVLAYNAANTTPNLPGQALAATDNLAAFFWQKDSVAISLGDTELFQNQKDPLYYGDVYSGIVKMGGRCRRADWKGVAAIVQVP